MEGPSGELCVRRSIGMFGGGDAVVFTDASETGCCDALGCATGWGGSSSGEVLTDFLNEIESEG